MRCLYFERMVLPADPTLQAQYWNKRDEAEDAAKKSGHCSSCGTAFERKSNRQKYCAPCSAKNADKNRKAARRKYRQKPKEEVGVNRIL